ncbi:hypothetical protein ABW20_dc0102142 [Dactylellina cionopaga]|nr:hypothetical protein ABW20_dc0102142 [Dactylellina cionopaga]
MHFSNKPAALFALLCTSLPFTTPAPNFQSRQIAQCSTAGGCLTCTYRPIFLYYAYSIYIPDDKIIDETCGAGVLDNLHGRGCTITNWQCGYIDDGPAAQIWFNADPQCGGDDVGNALRAADTWKGFGGSKEIHEEKDI